MQGADPDDVARRLAEEARPQLGAEGFSDERIDELAFAFVNDHVGEGLNVGKDVGEPVTDDYPGQRPWAFAGGTIKQVIVDVSGEHFVDLEKEAVAMMSRE